MGGVYMLNKQTDAVMGGVYMLNKQTDAVMGGVYMLNKQKAENYNNKLISEKSTG